MTDNFFGLNFNNGNNNGVFIGGGQVGYNWQFGYGVLGVEADFDWAANNNNTGAVFTAVGPIQVTSNNRWITTVAARFGVTNGNWLFYGKAGGGWVGNEDFTVTNLRTGSFFNISNDGSNGGWLVGAGIEWAFAANWSAKVEYNYLGLEDRTFIVPAGSPFFPGDTFTRGNRNVQMVQGGDQLPVQLGRLPLLIGSVTRTETAHHIASGNGCGGVFLCSPLRALAMTDLCVSIGSPVVAIGTRA